jgi:hypothetical protein
MSLHIGALQVLYWDRVALESGKELLEQVLCDKPAIIPTSLSSYMHTDVLFHFDATILEAKFTWENVEVCDSDSDSDSAYNSAYDYHDDSDDENVYTFRDVVTAEIHRGTRVIVKDHDVSQNHTTTVVVVAVASSQQASTNIPEVKLSFSPSLFKLDEHVKVRFWDHVDYEPSEYVYKEWGVRNSENGDMHIKNAIRFQDGMAGVCLSK